MRLKIYLLGSVAFVALTNQAEAANGSINITGNQNSIYVATDNVSGTSFDNFTATSNSSTFKKDLIGTQTKNVVNQTLNFSGGTAQSDVIGLNRVKNGGNISQTNTINITGGTIEGDVLATADSGNYNGTSRRTSNNINITGGTFKGNIEGGAGANNNIITIKGGTFSPSNNSGDDDCGNQTLGAIYAGVSDSTTGNQSTNGTVILKDMTDTNSFLTSFVEGNDGVSGTIFGSNLTGSSNMQFENVKGTYNGGLRNFNNVSVDANSRVTLGGKSYYGDNWTINGTLNTNGKTIHSYKNPTLNLTIGSTGNLTQQFISDANINATNQGSINGINTNKNISLSNSGKMTGNYTGSTINITNSGIINSLAGQTTSISSQNSGTLTNSGQIKETLSVSGAVSINNVAGGLINAQIKNNQSILNIDNLGTITSSVFNNIGNKQINLVNKSGGNITNALSLVNGTLNLTNNSGGNLTSNSFSADNGIFNISNYGTMSGNQSFTSLNAGTINFANNTTGTLSGNLSINSGLNNFSNSGLFQDLNINNQQSGVTLENSGTISGTGSILSNSLFTLNNQTNGNISGTQTLRNVNLNNLSGAQINNLTLTADGGVTSLANSGTINGNNILNSTNSGTINFANNTTGTLSGNLSINSVLNNFSNSGLFQDLNINNQQDNKLKNDGSVVNTTFITDNSTLEIENSGSFSGNNQFSSLGNGTFSLANKASGLISGQFTSDSGLSSLENEGVINNWSLVSDGTDFTINNNGEFSGSNIFNTNETVTFNNNKISTGNITLNGASFVMNHNSSSVLDNNFIGLQGNEKLEINNGASSSISSSLSGAFNQLTLRNNNSDLTLPNMSLINNANINTQISLGNSGYTQFRNNATIAADITDNLTVVADNQCLINKFDLENNGLISGDISVKNNIFNFTNNSSGIVTSEHIDSRELHLNNSGTFQNSSTYTLGVQDYIDINNSGTINGGDMVVKLTGNNVRGQITNTGTIWSYGTTIGMADNLVSCPDCNYGNSLSLYNKGTLMAVDPVNFVIPDLNSFAINVPTMDVYNQSGGTIGGSLNVNNYSQEGGSTWVAFMDKDKTLMSTITAQNKISVAPGSVLYIHTNNDILKFTDGQQFKVVSAQGMKEDEVKTQLNNYILKTDTPFANYSMVNNGSEGYIVFNKVAATKFAAATDMTTANHSNLASGSHRLFELFVNRNMKSTPTGMSSGDNDMSVTHIAFMPVAGHAHQKDDTNHVGYKSDYYGGIGYIEHNFTPSVKMGLGLSYLNNDTNYNDVYQSTSDTDSYRPFAYINYNSSQWRFDLAAGWGKHKIKNNRKYSFNENLYLAQSKYDSDEFSAHFSAGYRFYFEDNLIFQPMAGLFGANIKTDTYEETGNGPMNMHVESEDYNSVKTMLGMKVKKEYKLDNGMVLKPEMHLRWYHELADTNGGVNAYFLAQQELFGSNGIDAPRDMGDVAFRLTTENDENFDIFVESFYQFGKDFYNIGGTVGLKYNF